MTAETADAASTTAGSAPPPPWFQPKRPRGAARTPLTRDAIVDAAMALIGRDGLDAVSMRAVAEELDTAAGSLYWHIRSKDELLMLVYDRVMGEVPLPEPDPARWQDQLRELGRATRAVLGRHRDVAHLALGRIPTGPNMVRLMEWLLSLLRRAGVPDDRLGYVGDLFGLFVAAYAYEERLHERTLSAEDAETPAIVQAYFASLPPDDFPTLSTLAPTLMTGDPDTRFEVGLDLLVAGISALVPARR